MSVKTVERMLEWVENNLEEHPTLEELSGVVGYSSFYCSAKFHEHVGMSFKDYVQKRRLSLAANALQTTGWRILDIAVQFGFSSHEAFTRAFVRAYGCTPFQYRRRRPDVALLEKVTLKHS